MSTDAQWKLKALWDRLKKFDDSPDGSPDDFKLGDDSGQFWHRFDRKSIVAVEAAYAAGRPLLVRGEPGIGKSQLARAVAVVLGIPFHSYVVDERSEKDDLLFHYDAVSRLSEAQMIGALAAQGDKQEEIRTRMRAGNFIKPGVMWWAFNPDDANKVDCMQIDSEPTSTPQSEVSNQSAPSDLPTCIVLIDEIDKADPAVPNGLLECLANGQFPVPIINRIIRCDRDKSRPLILVTTNEERELPEAFLRRCLVHEMVFPKEKNEAIENLSKRARANWTTTSIDDEVIGKVCEYLLDDREKAKQDSGYRPGFSEFLDILRVLDKLHPADKDSQITALDEIREFALKKNKSH